MFLFFFSRAFLKGAASSQLPAIVAALEPKTMTTRFTGLEDQLETQGLCTVYQTE